MPNAFYRAGGGPISDLEVPIVNYGDNTVVIGKKKKDNKSEGEICDVLLLRTEKPDLSILINLSTKWTANSMEADKIHGWSEASLNLVHICNHIHFLSNEDYCENDLVYNTESHTIGKAIRNGKGGWLKRILATTDPALCLPLIPMTFIEQYIMEYGDINQIELAMDNFYMRPIILNNRVVVTENK